MLGDPLPLGDAEIIAFIPDSTCAWVVVYASECPVCEDEDDKHDRLYLVPMIGWLHVDKGGFEMRPAIMTSDGCVNDYLDMPPQYKFVAVLQDSEDTLSVARVIYRKRFGGDLPDEEAIEGALAN